MALAPSQQMVTAIATINNIHLLEKQQKPQSAGGDIACSGICNGGSAVSNDGNSVIEQYLLHEQLTISWWQHHL